MSLVRQFMDITNTSKKEAERYLQLANNDINNAIVLYYESQDDQQDYQQPQQPQKQQPIQKQQPQKQSKSSYEQNQPGSNFHQFRPQETAREQMVNGGESVALYRPKKDQKLQLTLYQNGFLLNDKFFDYQDPINIKYRDDIMKTQQMPQQLLNEVGIDSTNIKDLDTQVIDNSQMTYEKAVENNQAKPQLPEFEGEGKIISGTTKPFINDGQTVNINLNHAETKIKVKADKNYIISCNTKHKLSDILQYLVKQKYLNSISVSRLQAQTATGKNININQTIKDSQIQGKAINLFYVE